jgi:hypothetical protein
VDWNACQHRHKNTFRAWVVEFSRHATSAGCWTLVHTIAQTPNKEATKSSIEDDEEARLDPSRSLFGHGKKWPCPVKVWGSDEDRGHLLRVWGKWCTNTPDHFIAEIKPCMRTRTDDSGLINQCLRELAATVSRQQRDTTIGCRSYRLNVTWFTLAAAGCGT